MESNKNKFNKDSFCPFYNFMFLLQKRLKMRIKQDKKQNKFKFKKVQDFIRKEKRDNL